MADGDQPQRRLLDLGEGLADPEPPHSLDFIFQDEPLQLPIGRIAAGEERQAIEKRAETWMFTGTARKFTKSWIEINAGGRTWRSTHSIPKYQARARQALDRLISPGAPRA